MTTLTANQEIAAARLEAQLDAMTSDPEEFTMASIQARLEAARAASAARKSTEGEN